MSTHVLMQTIHSSDFEDIDLCALPMETIDFELVYAGSAHCCIAHDCRNSPAQHVYTYLRVPPPHTQSIIITPYGREQQLQASCFRDLSSGPHSGRFVSLTGDWGRGCLYSCVCQYV